MAVAPLQAPPQAAGHLAPLLALDPDLGILLSEDRLAAARVDLIVPLLALGQGEWAGGELSGASPDHVGLLVVRGAIAREVVLADTISTELLGPGDVIRPWMLESASALLGQQVRWQVLAAARLAVLDRAFGAAVLRFPEVNSVLLDRLNARAERLATMKAISQLTCVDRRLIALFWHLAERWGRVTPDGVVVPLALSHRMLGELVGARRPTVSAALAALTRNGEVRRHGEGAWVLTARAPRTIAGGVVSQRRSARR
jgi:CRP/FNR family cyclic AMP-dependent transcriptional regulator